MKSIYRLVLVILGFLGLVLLANYQTNNDISAIKTTNNSSMKQTVKFKTEKLKKITIKHPVEGQVVICVVACGNDRLDESLTMLKSALVFSKRPLKFIVISDYGLIPAFHEKLTEWKQIVNNTFDFIVRPVTFPADINDANMWRKLFKPCAAQRLFLPVSKEYIAIVIGTLFKILIKI